MVNGEQRIEERIIMEKELRIIISGGGTGGHIFPAVSIANAITELRPDAKIPCVGAEGRMEMQRVPDAGYEIIGLPIAGFDRKRLWKNMEERSMMQNSDVVVGTLFMRAQKIIKGEFCFANGEKVLRR